MDSSSFNYEPAHQFHAKDNVQKYEFDSPNTIAKHAQFQPAGGFQQAGGFPTQGFSIPAPPALPRAHTLNLRNKSLTLKTRDWNSKPWSWESSEGRQQGTYAPPASLMNSSWSSLHPVYSSSSSWGGRTISSTSSSPRTPGLLGVYDPAKLLSQTSHLSQSPSINHPTYSATQGGISSYPSSYTSSNTGLPSSTYTPSSTIPLTKNFHLPSSSLAHSSVPSSLSAPSLNKTYTASPAFQPPLGKSWYQSSGFQPSGMQSNIRGAVDVSPSTVFSSSSSSSSPSSSFASNIPTPPAMPTWGRNKSWRSQRSMPMRPLRTRNWGSRSDNGWSNFSWSPATEQRIFSSRVKAAPMAPAVPSFLRQRKWTRGPYRQRPLRTRNWGLRSDNGWSNFNWGMYAHESALPFNRSRSLNWSDSQPVQAPIVAPVAAPIPMPVSMPISMPVAAPIAAPVAAPLLTGRKGRRAAKKAAVQQAIAMKLSTPLAAPIGDPAVNHYRRGAKATVPVTEPSTGVAPPTGSFVSRRRGRKNNLGRRHDRLATPAIPVPVSQAPYVTPVGAPLVAPLAAPIATVPVMAGARAAAPSYAAPAVIPTAQPIYNAQGSLASAVPLQKTFTQPIITARPTGSATF